MKSDFNESFRGRKFLIVGGAGFIGSHITERLLELGADTIVLDDFSNGKERNLPSTRGSLELIHGDEAARTGRSHFRCGLHDGSSFLSSIRRMGPPESDIPTRFFFRPPCRHRS